MYTIMIFSEQKWTDELQRCRIFAQEQYATSHAHYRRRRQTNKGRIEDQIVDGKMGELMAEKYLREHGFQCSAPDFVIYAAKNKSFAADLFCGNIPIHVKTQNSTSAERYGSSWVFQAGGFGFGHSDPCLDNSAGEWCVFVTLDHASRSANIVGPLDMQSVQPHFKHPKLEHLIGIKKCIYLTDIVNVQPQVPPPPAVTHPSLMDTLERLLQVWISSGFELTMTKEQMETAPDDVATGIANEWIKINEDVHTFNPQTMIDTALGKTTMPHFLDIQASVDSAMQRPWAVKVEEICDDSDSDNTSADELEMPPNKKNRVS